MLIDDIQQELNEWKSRGLTPSTIRISPLLIPVLPARDNPSEILGMKIVPHPCDEKGFFCSGPWNFSSVGQEFHPLVKRADNED